MAPRLFDYDDVILSWMDHYLKGVDNRVDREMPARYLVMGRDQWRDAVQWPPAAKEMPMFLAPPSGREHFARLQTRPFGNKDSFSQFISDPANPVTNPDNSSGAHDYAKLSDRSDVLTFDSAVLQQGTEVTGPIKARIFVSCDCRDFDLWVRLLDVSPDPTQPVLVLLMGCRASPRSCLLGPLGLSAVYRTTPGLSSFLAQRASNCSDWEHCGMS